VDTKRANGHKFLKKKFQKKNFRGGAIYAFLTPKKPKLAENIFLKKVWTKNF
jgi:hypothetical protein